jgi:dTDP-4-amino-4,6-dideoxygalactose transaminase
MGEGGAITFNDPKYIEFFDIKLNHGAIVTNGRLDFIDYGYNYRVSEIQCVMGIKQLIKLDEIIASRNVIRERYMEKLEPLGYQIQKISDKDIIYNVQSLVFKVPENIQRDKLIEYLKENGIETTIGTYSLSTCTYYAKKYNNVQKNAKYLEENTITFPCYHGVNIKYILKKISDY